MRSAFIAILAVISLTSNANAETAQEWVVRCRGEAANLRTYELTLTFGFDGDLENAEAPLEISELSSPAEVWVRASKDEHVLREYHGYLSVFSGQLDAEGWKFHARSSIDIPEMGFTNPEDRVSIHILADGSDESVFSFAIARAQAAFRFADCSLGVVVAMPS